MRSWRGNCEITSHERDYQPVDAAPARVQDHSRVARNEAICNRELLFPLSARGGCSVSCCWGRGSGSPPLLRQPPPPFPKQQQHMPRQYVRKCTQVLVAKSALKMYV
jgi:hypothetical protein